MSEKRKIIGAYSRKKVIGAYSRPQGSEAVPQPVTFVPHGSVILGVDTDTGQPVSVSQADLSQGCYIVGVQGMGKTSLLEQIMYQQMQLNEAIIVLDPHGDLINAILAHMPEQRLADTYLLDLKDRAYPFGLNAFTCRNPHDEEERDTTRSQIMHAFEKLWPETREGQYFNKLLRHVIITLLENPELTLADARRLLLDSDFRNRYTRHLKNAASRDYWQMEYNSLSERKRQTESSPLRSRLDQPLTEPVIHAILRQTTKPLNIRELIEEHAVLLVKLPVNEEAYKYSAPVIGTFLMSMIYAATFSFADVPLEKRPGFTLIVDEFQNFATDEYAKLFEQGRKYKVKQFLAHQHRQQLERGSTARTNLAATLSANTIVAFRTITHDSRELASLFSGITARRRPTDISIHPLEKIDEYPHPLVKQFVLDVVDKLDEAAGQKLVTERHWYKDISNPRFHRNRPSNPWEYPIRSYTEKVNPVYDFGAGTITASPKQAEQALTLLNRLIYESEERGEVTRPLREQFIETVTPFWKLKIYKPELRYKKPEEVTEAEIKYTREVAEAKTRYTRFVSLLDTVLAILIHSPIAEDMGISNTDIASMLEDLEKREAFIKTGSQAFSIKTRDTKLCYSPTATNARARHSQIQRQTRERFCIPRLELERRELEPEEEMEAEPESEQDFSIIDTSVSFIPESPEVVSELLPPQRLEEPASPPNEQRGKQPKPPLKSVKPKAPKQLVPPPEPEYEPDDTPWQPYTEL